MSMKIISSGLSKAEAAGRLKSDGYNELPTAKEKSFFYFLIEILKEPMIALLLAAGGLYIFLGDMAEAMLLLLSIVGVVAISLYQERKSEKSLQALTQLSSPRALVIRSGEEIRIAGREVVVGDLILLAEGDRVPADAQLIEATNLRVDESLLTGESVPVDKNPEAAKLVYSGSLVVSGHARAVVVATGLNTELGKIGSSLKSIEIEKTLLQKEITLLVRYLAVIGLVTCVLLAGIYTLTRGDLVQGILSGLTLAIGILPEEFPIVLLLFITMGAWRLAKHNVLARRAASIETLGAATVLCVDKTGTLTENKMTIEKIYLESGEMLLNDFVDDEDVVKYGLLASQRKPFDPMEAAFVREGKIYLDLDTLYDTYELVKEYPVTSDFLCVAHAYKVGDKYEVALKGSAEAVLELCHMTAAQKRNILGEVSAMASDGYRVLGVARGVYTGKKLPESRHDIKFQFLGMTALADPIRRGVKESIDTAKEAGVRVIMITGDYQDTALSIARQIGLTTSGVLSGASFEAMSLSERKKALATISVFSRVVPEQKLLIVEALKGMGEVVAMTGDGVNDAPALKAAHIGIAMGQRGTDVAREAASIVLLDDNFNSIVGGVKLGRRIYDNLQKAVGYLIAVHIPIVALSMFPVLFGWPLVLFPAHIVFLEFIIDPTCTIVFESDTEDSDIMSRRPRGIRDRIVSFGNLLGPIGRGLLSAVILVVSYGYLLPLVGENMARTFVFTLLVAVNLVLILVGLSKREFFLRKLVKNDNKALVAVILFTVTVLYLATNIPFFMKLFRFSALPTAFLWGILGSSLVVLLVGETAKLKVFHKTPLEQ